MLMSPSFLSQIVLAATLAAPPPDMEAQLLFPPQPKHVHSSSIVQTPAGDLLACWYYGSGERRANDVRIDGVRYSRATGRWSAAFTMADTPALPDCNPVLFVGPRGRLWLFWVVVQANRWEHAVLKYRRADRPDGDGPPRWSWQDTIHLVPGDSFARSLRDGFDAHDLDEDMWAEYARPYSKMLVEAAGDPIKRQTGWMTRTHPLALPSGRILLPLYSDGFNVSLVAMTDDGGETWRASRPIVGLGPIQPSIVRRRSGELVAYLRDSGKAPARALVSRSTDDGATWSPAIDSAIPNPGSSLECIALRDGRWLMVYNDTERGRHSLAVALSSDEGRTWNHRRHLERVAAGARGSFSYPSVIQARDGTIHVTYSYSVAAGESIKHARFEPAWVEGRDG